MEGSTLSQKQRMLLTAIRKLVRRGDSAALGRLIEKRRPVELADLLPHLNDFEIRYLLSWQHGSSRQAIVDILAEAEPSLVAPYLNEKPIDELVPLFAGLPPDAAARLLRVLPDETGAEILSRLNDERSEAVEALLTHQEGTAGALMSPDYFALLETDTVKHAIDVLQEAGDRFEMTSYLYVVNASRQLVGVISLRSLLTHPASTPLRELMIPEVIHVRPETSEEDVARIVARYNLLAVPVVDEFTRLIGIVTVDDVIDVIGREATQDIMRMGGAPEEDPAARSMPRSVRTRAPWLLVTLVAGILGSELIVRFGYVLAQTLVLVGFIPVMVGLAGNAGNQSATLIARGLATARLEPGGVWRVLWHEIRVGLILGLLSGFLLGGFVALRYADPPILGMAIGLSAALSVLASNFFGALSPFVLGRLNLDPGFATGPFISTVVDLFGIAVYLFLSAVLLHANAGGLL